MSASPMARQVTESKSIPIRRTINDHSELPSDYSTTPGGTLYSTTPGGTKIVYEKSFLMHLKGSPISKTPPKFDIPEALQKGTKYSPPKRVPKMNHHVKRSAKEKTTFEDQDQFALEL
ncbi:eukaryotic translation initiation factor 4E-binding protein [Onthophagus taurus]|uniref:eukaryotic translation initiation factor 4E-binding protein n=1 Tax=Onthophagus taurus TaxID=166361 RepID=UPI000C205FDD|nr:eukaryotic translation initiation factor 4E-binding protein 1 [Onthophagus taurus]